MTPEQVDEIATALVCKIREQHHTLWLDSETHSNQHEFIKMLIQEKEDKIARREAIADKIAGSLILSFLLAIITLLGVGAMTYLRNYLK